MKKFFVLAVAALALCACTNPNQEFDETAVSNPEKVTFTFHPYTQEVMTRAGGALADEVERLDVWLYEGTAKTAPTKTEAVAEVHQTKTDTDFGTLTVRLDQSKKYTLYAIAHNESAPTTISNGIVSFPDAKKRATYYYTTTFTPEKTTNLDCRMKMAVGLFRVIITDKVPEDVKKFNVSVAAAPTAWSFPQLGGTNPRPDSYAVEWTKWSSTADSGETMFSVFILAGNDEQPYDVTVTAYGADGEIIKQHSFPSTPIRSAYRTAYKGAFFLDSSFSPTFTIDDTWTDNIIDF